MMMGGMARLSRSCKAAGAVQYSLPGYAVVGLLAISVALSPAYNGLDNALSSAA